MVLRDGQGTIRFVPIAEAETRVRRIMKRRGFETRQEAERYVEENDKARTAFYKRFFGVHPQDARGYHMVLNTELMGETTAADMVMAALETLGQPA